MKSSSIAVLILLLASVILILESPNKEIILNEIFIYNLYHPNNTKEFPKFTFAPDLNNPEDVFDFIFSHLDKEVFVYPSENYYYFEFPVDEKLIAGNIALPAHIRDEGKVSFAYFDKAKVRDSNISHVNKIYNENDGVIVKKIDDFNYSITFKDKTVDFRLNTVGIEPPKRIKLTQDEKFIGTSFDESGMKFFLLYNDATNSFYWVLDEEGFIPEIFTKNESVIISHRTGFAFYNDEESNRRLLIGVNFGNTYNNNWYDGPFDQLPDNYIKTGKIDIKKYIEMVYPDIGNYIEEFEKPSENSQTPHKSALNIDVNKSYSKPSIDKYSYFSNKPGVRVSINPYYDYDNEAELVEVVSRCKSLQLKQSEFYACITKSNNGKQKVST